MWGKASVTMSCGSVACETVPRLTGEPVLRGMRKSGVAKAPLKDIPAASDEAMAAQRSLLNFHITGSQTSGKMVSMIYTRQKHKSGKPSRDSDFIGNVSGAPEKKPGECLGLQ